MPRWDGFGRSLAFAALAAAGLPVATTFVAPWLGAQATLRLYLIAAAVAYAAGLGGDRSRRVASGGAGALAGAALFALPLGPAGTALGAAAIVAALRSGLLHWQRPLRALAIEASLGTLGLVCAAQLAAGGGVGAWALALWAYFLVQSAYFVVGGRRARGAPPAADPFDLARRRLERLFAD